MITYTFCNLINNHKLFQPMYVSYKRKRIALQCEFLQIFTNFFAVSPLLSNIYINNSMSYDILKETILQSLGKLRRINISIF